ncbi:MAG TPA: hypothetical protein VGK95_07875 [Caldimonas sp.]
MVFALCVGAFMPPFVEGTVSSIPLTVAFGIAIAVSFVLHVAFVGIAAHRANRSAALWLFLPSFYFRSGQSSGSFSSSGSVTKATVAQQSAVPDPFEGTSSGKLRLPAAAAHVERQATRVPLHALSGALQYDRHYEHR